MTSILFTNAAAIVMLISFSLPVMYSLFSILRFVQNYVTWCLSVCVDR